MSDLLTSLASRALGIARSTVQPRLRSQYEPSSLASSPGLMEEGGFEVQVEREAPIPRSRATSARWSVPAPLSAAESGPSKSEEAVPGVDVVQTRRADHERADSRPVPVDESVAIDDLAPSQTQSIPMEVTGSSMETRFVEHESTAPSDSSPDEPAKGASRIVHEDLLIERIEQQTGIEHMTHTVHEMQRTSGSPPGVAVTAIRVVEGTSPDVALDSPPTINVSIGRIEVRAAAATPAPSGTRQAQRPAPPSLNDYLRQRSGGRS